MSMSWVGIKPGTFIDESAIVPLSAGNLNAIVNTIDKIAIGANDSGINATTLQGFYKESFATTSERGLQNYYSFDYNDGITIPDDSNQNNTATGNNITFSDGIAGSSAYFNGTSSYVESTYANVTEFTLSLWYRGATTSADRRLITLYNTPTTYKAAIYINAGIPEFRFRNVAGSVFSEASPLLINDNQWHHIAGTYDGVSFALYIDGLLQQTITQTLITTYHNRLRIGASEESTPLSFTEGYIDEVKIYNRALTGIEIAGLFFSKMSSKVLKSSSILSLLKNVDGPGSGLDADLFDSIQSENFIFGTNGRGTRNSSNIDTILKSGFYYSTDTVRNPTATNYHIIHQQCDSVDSVAYQIGVSYGTNPETYIRNKVDTWGSWVKLWNANNDGPGSGLDADLLDGLTGQDYRPFQTIRDFPLGTLIQTDIAYVPGLDGAPWFLEITGNTYGRLRGINLQAQGYIYNSGPMLHYGGVAVGNGITGLVVGSLNGYMYFWFPQQSYWEGYLITVRHLGGDNRNHVITVTNAAKPTFTGEIPIPIAVVWDSANDHLISRYRFNITDGANLNNFDYIGFYIQRTDASARTGYNYPPAGPGGELAGTLFVHSDAISSPYITQRYVLYTGSRTYQRSFNGVAWSPWVLCWDSGSDGNQGQPPMGRLNVTGGPGHFMKVHFIAGQQISVPNWGGTIAWFVDYPVTFSGIAAGIAAAGTVLGTASTAGGILWIKVQ